MGRILRLGVAATLPELSEWTLIVLTTAKLEKPVVDDH